MARANRDRSVLRALAGYGRNYYMTGFRRAAASGQRAGARFRAGVARMRGSLDAAAVSIGSRFLSRSRIAQRGVNTAQGAFDEVSALANDARNYSLPENERRLLQQLYQESKRDLEETKRSALQEIERARRQAEDETRVKASQTDAAISEAQDERFGRLQARANRLRENDTERDQRQAQGAFDFARFLRGTRELSEGFSRFLEGRARSTEAIFGKLAGVADIMGNSALGASFNITGAILAIASPFIQDAIKVQERETLALVDARLKAFTAQNLARQIRENPEVRREAGQRALAGLLEAEKAVASGYAGGGYLPEYGR